MLHGSSISHELAVTKSNWKVYFMSNLSHNGLEKKQLSSVTRTFTEVRLKST